MKTIVRYSSSFIVLMRQALIFVDKNGLLFIFVNNKLAGPF